MTFTNPKEPPLEQKLACMDKLREDGRLASRPYEERCACCHSRA